MMNTSVLPWTLSFSASHDKGATWEPPLDVDARYERHGTWVGCFTEWHVQPCEGMPDLTGMRTVQTLPPAQTLQELEVKGKTRCYPRWRRELLNLLHAFEVCVRNNGQKAWWTVRCMRTLPDGACLALTFLVKPGLMTWRVRQIG